MSPAVDIVVNAAAWETLPDLEDLAARAVEQSALVAGARLAKDCELCIVFCDDAEIRGLNAQWRGQDKPTNVLSFATPGALAAKPLLGDIVIAFETVAREAREQDKSLADHASHMIIHGFLHLIGYDHETPAEAEAMEALERRVAETLGIRDPYDGTRPIDGAEGIGSTKSHVGEN
ncbi:MAG: rRNA maturation RNase YbeY [Methylocystis sp.]